MDIDPVVLNIAMEQLRRRLAADLVTRSPGYIVGVACLNAMVKIVLSRKQNIPPQFVTIVDDTLMEYCKGTTVPMVLRITAHKAYARFIAGRHSWATALEFALFCTTKAAVENNTLASALARAAWEEVAALAPAAAVAGQPVARKPLLRAATLVRQCSDSRIRHLAFVTLRRLQQQPPTIYIPQDHLVLPFPEETVPVLPNIGMQGKISLAGMGSLPVPMDLDGNDLLLSSSMGGGAGTMFSAVPDAFKEKIKLKSDHRLKGTTSGFISGGGGPAISTGAPAVSSGGQGERDGGGLLLGEVVVGLNEGGQAGAGGSLLPPTIKPAAAAPIIKLGIPKGTSPVKNVSVPSTAGEGGTEGAAAPTLIKLPQVMKIKLGTAVAMKKDEAPPTKVHSIDNTPTMEVGEHGDVVPKPMVADVPDAVAATPSGPAAELNIEQPPMHTDDASVAVQLPQVVPPPPPPPPAPPTVTSPEAEAAIPSEAPLVAAKPTELELPAPPPAAPVAQPLPSTDVSQQPPEVKKPMSLKLKLGGNFKFGPKLPSQPQ